MNLFTTIQGLLVLLALITTLLSIAGKTPLWIAVLFLCVFGLLQVLPLK